MNDLVKRLTVKTAIEANRADKTPKALQERIELGHVHIMFKATGTELPIILDRKNCKLDSANFSTGEGSVHLDGVITLNYDRVRCIADIDLKTLDGDGYLVPVSEAEYNLIVKK
jgi:hypothetical protein